MAGCLDDNTIADFLKGRVADPLRVEIEAHVDACPSCRMLLSELARLSFTSAEEPAPASAAAVAPAVGRYLIVDYLGAGAMGVVFSAYDPRLDRKVAVKILHPRAKDDDGARLLREAQTMARLSHPNVCTVHDTGDLGESIFVAMELVSGSTLRAWCAAEPRAWRELRDAFVHAGRGLAAAHDVGIVHRDFKPDNVLCGDDGRICVTDFGLARRLKDAPDGAVVGTPGYMAPEQHRGEEASASADQYSFGIALYEALVGRLPYTGGPGELARAKALPPPAGELDRVPRWLKRAMLRAIAPRPEDRFPSMAALLAALTPARKTLVALPVGATVVVAACALWLARGHRQDAPACDGAAELAGVWDDARRAEVQHAFEASGRPFAAHAWQAVSAVLDPYSREWRHEFEQTCARHATPVSDLQLLCLAQRRHELAALGEIFAHADGAVLDKAAQAARALAPPADCADPRALASSPPLPKEAAARARVDAAATATANAKALEIAGKYKDGFAAAKAAHELADGAGYRPLQAQAAYELGLLADRTDDPGAEAALRQAVRAAEGGHADDLLALARVRLVELAGKRPDTDLTPFVDEAWGAIERLGAANLTHPVTPAERLAARLLEAQGAVWQRRGKYPAALAFFGAALAIRARSAGAEDLELATNLTNLGATWLPLGGYEQARALDERALAIMTRLLGDTHPFVASVLSNLGGVEQETGRCDVAVERFARAADIFTQNGSGSSAAMARVRSNWGNCLGVLGRTEEAIAQHRLALAVREQLYGPEHPDVARSLGYLGDAALELGKLDDAITYLVRARTILERAPGADLGFTELSLGRAYLEKHDPDGAQTAFARALELLRAALGPAHPSLAVALTGLGQVKLDARQPAAARALLEEATQLGEAAGGDPRDLAEARFALAQALEGDDRARARTLAELARVAFVQSGKGAEKEVAAVVAWQQARRP